MPPINVGDEAPDFDLPAVMGNIKQRVKLSDYRGKKNVVLVFYPADWTPVCSAELPAFNGELEKFEGYVVHANIAQLTVRAKGNDLAIQTFALNQIVSAKMQKIVDNGGYQYGDKVTVYYDPASRVVMKIKGKPSRPL